MYVEAPKIQTPALGFDSTKAGVAPTQYYYCIIQPVLIQTALSTTFWFRQPLLIHQ